MNRQIAFKTSRASIQEFVTNSSIAIALLIFPWYLEVYNPVAYIFFITEDSWSEYITFVLWCITAAMLGWTIFRNPEFRKPGYLVFAIAAFLMAMEEISWGQRIFDISTPDFIRDLNVQGELTFHNFLASHQYRDYLGITVFTAVVIVPVAAGIFPAWRSFCTRWGIPLVPVQHWPLFAVPLYYFDWNYSLFGIARGHSFELAELGLAVATAIFTMSIILRNRKTASHKGPPAIALLVLATLLSAPLVKIHPEPGGLRWAFDHAATGTFPRLAMYRQAAKLFDYMILHPDFAYAHSSYYHGLVLQELQQPGEAQDVLTQALAQATTGKEWNENASADHRRVGRILHALGRLGEACEAYLQALTKDHESLASGPASPEEAMLRWSLAKTFFAMGQWDAAAVQVDLAMKLRQSRSTQHRITRWHKNEKQNASQGRLVPHVITPTEPACIDGLNQYATNGPGTETGSAPQSGSVEKCSFPVTIYVATGSPDQPVYRRKYLFVSCKPYSSENFGSRDSLRVMHQALV